MFPSAVSKLFIGESQVRLVRTLKMGTDSLRQVVGGEQTVRAATARVWAPKRLPKAPAGTLLRAKQDEPTANITPHQLGTKAKS